MEARPYKPETLVDGVFSFEAGVNEGIGVLLLPKNQLARGVNITLRGDFIGPRPPFVQRALDFQGDANAADAFENGLFQGACYYFGDDQSASIMAAISGRLFQILLGDVTAVVTEMAITGGPNPADRTLAWLWQAEKWVFWNDGLSPCIFWTPGLPAVRSDYGLVTQYAVTVDVPGFAIPNFGATVNANLLGADIANLVVGDIVTVQNQGQFQVTDISASPQFALFNLNALPSGFNVPAGVAVSWQHSQGKQLPPGRMGAYVRGRNCVSLVDGKQFVFSDLVGGASGTLANNRRDAILSITENFYLTGGGNFSVPGSVGEITAMRAAVQLDASLGQGPLQIFTEEIVFSCMVPNNRLDWQNVTNPILTESVIDVGAEGQNPTVTVNSDILYRSSRGFNSLILARRDFGTWGNAPISFEVDPLLRNDTTGLLRYGSSVVSDNRFLSSIRPTPSERGIFHKGLVVINFDPVSTLRGKQPSIWEGLYTGVNPVQLITGRVNKTKRCFALTLNSDEKPLELWELLPSETDIIYDNDEIPIVSEVEFPLMDFGESRPEVRRLKRLLDGEVYLDNIRGKVDMEFYYRADQAPCWQQWIKFSVCSGADDPKSGKPSFQPRIGLGQPDPSVCDPITQRPAAEGYVFQVRMLVRGHYQFLGMRCKANTVPEADFAAPICVPVCEEVT